MGYLGTKKPNTTPAEDVRVGNWRPLPAPPTRDPGEVNFQSDLQSAYTYTQPSRGAHKRAANHCIRSRGKKGCGGGAKGADQSVPRSKNELGRIYEEIAQGENSLSYHLI